MLIHCVTFGSAEVSGLCVVFFALSVSFASASIKAALKEGVWARGLETQVGACTESENREGYPLDMVPAACTHKGGNILSSTLSNALAGFGRQR